MIPILSREQVRELDRAAIEDFGVPSLELMENAGRGAANFAEAELAKADRRGPVVVVCGPGNNGGDGFVVARRLAERGRELFVVCTVPGNKLKGDARINYDAYRAQGGDVLELGRAPLELALGRAALVVDALLGTGLDRDVGGPIQQVIEQMNHASAPRLALDIPSGLDANTGKVLGAAVSAELTVTFAAPKLGLFAMPGAEYAGRVETVQIGVPAAAYERVGWSAELFESSDVARAIRPRAISAHKGSAGRVVAIAGSPGKTGAALLVARGALRAGAGLVTIATTPEACDALDGRVLEEMTARIDPASIEKSLEAVLSNADAVAIGPGFGLDAGARRIVEHVVLDWEGPKVVDADAISHFAGRASELARARGKLLLTPHPGEMGRLLGSSTADVERDRFGAVARAVELTGATVLLKGPRTIVGSPQTKPAVNARGRPALATGGAGDVLTGISAALACQLELRLAALCAAHLHGIAAERWVLRTGADRGLLAHEVADELPFALAGLSADRPPLPV